MMRLTWMMFAAMLTTCSGFVIGGGMRTGAVDASTRVPAPTMGLMDFLANMLYDKSVTRAANRPGAQGAAGSTALSRLKVVLAHDRAGLDPQTMDKIRDEIQEVVSKCVPSPVASHPLPYF